MGTCGCPPERPRALQNSITKHLPVLWLLHHAKLFTKVTLVHMDVYLIVFINRLRRKNLFLCKFTFICFEKKPNKIHSVKHIHGDITEVVLAATWDPQWPWSRGFPLSYVLPLPSRKAPSAHPALAEGACEGLWVLSAPPSSLS